MGRGPRKRKLLEAVEETRDRSEEKPADGHKVQQKDGRKKLRARARKGVQKKGLRKSRERTQDQVAPHDNELPHPVVARAQRIAAWADDTKKQEQWLSSRGGTLEAHLMEAKGSMVHLRDYFPMNVANSVLAVLEALPESAWQLSDDTGDKGAASHRFWSLDVCDVPELLPLRSVFWRMLPTLRGEPTLPIFSAGRYGRSDFIGRHDDRAHVPFNGAENMYSRTVAAIWYLTYEWQEEEGGSIVDLQGEAPGLHPEKASPEVCHLPIYNKLSVFEVPHWHAVTAVTSDRYRYSIFGWWHQQGLRYELPSEEDNGAAAVAKRPRKKRKKSHVKQ